MSRAQFVIGEWLRSVPVQGTGFEQVDVDHLGERRDWSRPDVLAWALELFEALGTEVRSTGRSESVLLVVPLAYSDKLVPAAPDFAGMLSATWAEVEVPGLYVFNDLHILGWDCEEEYRSVLTSTPVVETSRAYYRCWRTAPLEFARALYFLRHAERPVSV